MNLNIFALVCFRLKIQRNKQWSHLVRSYPHLITSVHNVFKKSLSESYFFNKWKHPPPSKYRETSRHWTRMRVCLFLSKTKNQLRTTWTEFNTVFQCPTFNVLPISLKPIRLDPKMLLHRRKWHTLTHWRGRWHPSEPPVPSLSLLYNGVLGLAGKMGAVGGLQQEGNDRKAQLWRGFRSWRIRTSFILLKH